MKFRVTFERIGRGFHGGEHTFEVANADDLAEKIYDFAASHLASREYEVVVDLKAGTGSIEYGRFGTFTVVECFDSGAPRRRKLPKEPSTKIEDLE